jgi:hypothetical protein
MEEWIMKPSLKYFIVLSLILLTYRDALAFTVILKTGEKIQGTLISENSSHMEIRNSRGTVYWFPKIQIDLQATSIFNSPAAESPKKADHQSTLAASISTPPNLNPTKPPSSNSELPHHRLWKPYIIAANAYDSNIYHDSAVLVDSLGVIFGAGVHWQNRESKPSLEFVYEIAKHSYSHTDQWDRISQDIRASYDWKWSKQWSLETELEAALKGATEDREIGNQYIFNPELKYRITRSDRIRLIGVYRLKRYSEIPDRNATNYYYGLGYEHRFGNYRVEFKARREHNLAEGSRYDWLRYVYSIEYSMPFLKRNLLLFQVDNKPQDYVSRLAKIKVENGPDIEFLRRDVRWVFTVQAIMPFGEHWELRPGYTYENRSSNDPDKFFDSHAPYLSLRYIW